MAKAKKQAATSDAPAPAGKKSSKKAAEPAAKAAPAAPAVPQIDTNLAASTAAKLVARKDAVAAATAGAASGSGDSASFKQMKENLHKPAGGSTPSFLQNAAPGKKFNNSVPGRNQQIGRNQTFGADVNRTGVPRRTGGG